MPEKRLLVTDLDGTLLGDDVASQELLAELAKRGIDLALASGRHLLSIQELYKTGQLSLPASACICMVGTEIYYLEGKSYKLDASWNEIVRPGWNEEAIDSILSSKPDAVLQDETWLSPLKRSYFLEQNSNDVLAQIRNELSTRGIAAKIIFSANKYLDIIPEKAGKGEAAKHVARHMGVLPANVVTCGDTGNDLDMMRPELGFRSIVVGNATTELSAIEGHRIYHAKQHFAAGILEGLIQIGWL